MDVRPSDVIIVGTGFASSFFLKRYLEHAPAGARVLVLERGGTDTKPWQLANRRTSSLAPEDVFVNLTPEKEWLTSPGFGGNSKCWWGGAARMMPGDFQLRTRYGVGSDWPLSYDDLEAHYGVVEELMSVSGPADSPCPARAPSPCRPIASRLRTPCSRPAFHRAGISRPRRGPACRLHAGQPVCQRHLRAVPRRCEVHHPERDGRDLR